MIGAVYIQSAVVSKMSIKYCCNMYTLLMYIYICTMLLEQIKGFYHGITKIFLLVGSYTMLSWHF